MDVIELYFLLENTHTYIQRIHWDDLSSLNITLSTAFSTTFKNKFGITFSNTFPITFSNTFGSVFGNKSSTHHHDTLKTEKLTGCISNDSPSLELVLCRKSSSDEYSEFEMVDPFRDQGPKGNEEEEM